ncbi:phage tail-like protein [Gelidibacter algens]|uniref:Phage tail-like protein n=1 Tax=Gelidibacter algens TaxID=49280 RepID=A0A1A7QZC7_9FLAO|nr:phage tail protein [Gelidibacter algens]OBX24623.1 phage tail protein [Gelidibacter algens]RAJ27769.1 phage tail-like protein [Gelidibacter algens]
MTMFSVNTHRLDPYKNFKFRVKWDGRYIAAVSTISALKRTTESVQHRDGGSSTSRLSPGNTFFEPITLQRGLSHDTEFEDWANLVFNSSADAAMSLATYKKDIVIELFNLQGTPVISYRVYRCWVSEYQPLPELDANRSCIAFEKIVLQHEGWERDKDVKEPVEP